MSNIAVGLAAVLKQQFGDRIDQTGRDYEDAAGAVISYIYGAHCAPTHQWIVRGNEVVCARCDKVIGSPAQTQSQAQEQSND